MVIYVEDYWNTLMEVHDKELFHAGEGKTFHKACHSSIVTVIDISYVFLHKLIQVQSTYCGIPHSVVLEFVKACTTCQLRRPQHARYSSTETHPCFGIYESITCTYSQLLLVYCIELCPVIFADKSH